MNDISQHECSFETLKSSFMARKMNKAINSRDVGRFLP